LIGGGIVSVSFSEWTRTNIGVLRGRLWYSRCIHGTYQTAAFGFIGTTVGCYYGLSARQNSSVGRAATQRGCRFHFAGGFLRDQILDGSFRLPLIAGSSHGFASNPVEEPVRRTGISGSGNRL
jgi:hypothetical protein